MSQIPEVVLFDHSIIYVAMALAVSLGGSWLLVCLIDHLTRSSKPGRPLWFVCVATVAGVTVWTTHFIAMLGYRPDLFLSYEFKATLVSFMIGWLVVGIPLASSCLAKRRWIRGAFGCFAGFGIALMHLTGMSAIVDCYTSQNLFPVIVAASVGASAYAAARSVSNRHKWLPLGLFATGLCATHFLAVAGFATTPVSELFHSGWGSAAIGLMVAVGTFAIFGGGILSLIASGKFLAQEEAHADVLSTALNNMSNGLIYVGHDRKLRIFNERFAKIFDIAPSDIRAGMPISDLLQTMSASKDWNDDEDRELHHKILKRLASSRSITSDYRTKSGRVLQLISGPVSNGAVITFDDVTLERNAQYRITHLAYHDVLTGIGNRRALQERMEAGFLPKQHFKLLLIDLDRFKTVNDSLGHKIGDGLLKKVAARLVEASAGKHFVSRFGGDEFAMIVYGNLKVAMQIADKVISTLTNTAFEVEGHMLSIGCSIGMCCTDHAETVDDLLQQADVALYDAKRSGRGQATCYRDGLLEAVTERHRLERDIQYAIDNQDFRLAYQPIMSLKENRIIGYEALIRWHHVSRGTVSPIDFIPVAEETGQIQKIGRWVLEEACRTASKWPDDIYVAVNISPMQFKSAQLYADIVHSLEASGLPPRRLEIELTETALAQDGPTLSKTLGSLRELGITIALDDFGTGYSSLAHICDFPLDRIKIDRSFVQKAAHDANAMAVLRAITQIGRDINVSILAEGVETAEQLRLLTDLGCQDVQGYLIGRPAFLVKQPHDLKMQA